MLDWDKLRVFYAVAQAQSLTRAGETLSLSQSAVSRQVSALEEQLKVTLFHRHARGLILTEQGEILYQTVSEIFHRLNVVEDALIESKDKPKGPLRITTPVALGTLWLTPLIREFNQLYPDIEVSLLADDRELDLAMREADVAIRLNPARQPDLIQKKLMTIHYALYASGEYLAQFGAPADIDGLDKHRLIAFGEGQRLPFGEANWALGLGKSKGEQRPAAFRINNYLGMVLAAESGVGIAALPQYIACRRHRLKQVLPKVAGPSTDTYLIYSQENRSSKRLNVFKDFIQRKAAEEEF